MGRPAGDRRSVGLYRRSKPSRSPLAAAFGGAVCRNAAGWNGVGLFGGTRQIEGSDIEAPAAGNRRGVSREQFAQMDAAGLGLRRFRRRWQSPGGFGRGRGLNRLGAAVGAGEDGDCDPGGFGVPAPAVPTVPACCSYGPSLRTFGMVKP